MPESAAAEAKRRLITIKLSFKMAIHLYRTAIIGEQQNRTRQRFIMYVQKLRKLAIKRPT